MILVRVNVCGGLPFPMPGEPLKWSKVLREGVNYRLEESAWTRRMLQSRQLIRILRDGAPVERAPSQPALPMSEEDLDMLFWETEDSDPFRFCP